MKTARPTCLALQCAFCLLISFILTPTSALNIPTGFTPESIVNVQTVHIIRANFAANATYTLTANSGANGSILPAGITTLFGGQGQMYTITPDSSYRVKAVTVDGVNKGAINTCNFISVDANHTIDASFEKDEYTITSSVAIGSGTLTPPNTTRIAAGGSQTFAITPAPGYEINYVVVDGSSVGTVTSYTFSNVRQNHTIKAYFLLVSYKITATAEVDGTITPPGATNVVAGGSQTYTITPTAGYHVADVLVDGVSQGAVTSYSFNNVTAIRTISATFAENPWFLIDASAGPNGTISPTGRGTLLGGTNEKYTITPAAGYRANVIVDGVSTGAVAAYTFFNIQETHTINAAFVPDTFNLTTLIFGNGTASPAGTTTLRRGGSQTYIFTPGPGWQVKSVVVDGVHKGSITSYTFNNVTANHAINVYFNMIARKHSFK